MTSRRAVIFLLVIFLGVNSHAKDSVCAQKTKSGEKLLEQGMSGAAEPVLTEAVKVCAASHEKTARPYIALGKVYFEKKQYAEAIQQFEVALTQEPDLPLANMNIGAAYMQAGDLSKSLEYTKKALATPGIDKPTLMQSNFNLGLAYFKMAAAKNDAADRTSEPYFKKTRELGPDFGGSYYYLGVLQETSYHDFKAAKELYKKGCDLKYPPACQFLAAVDTRAGQAPPRTVANAKLSPPNEAIVASIISAYRRKKYDDNTIGTVSSNLRGSCSQMPDAQCRTMLENVLKSAQ